MADAMIHYAEASLSPELVSVAGPFLEQLKRGEYQEILESSDAQTLLRPHDEAANNQIASWIDTIHARINHTITSGSKHNQTGVLFCIGYAALLTFLQSNVTGPPLKFRPASTILPASIADNGKKYQQLTETLLASLGADGIAPYKLTPNIELFCLARAVISDQQILADVKAARWAQLRVNFLHQRLLSEVSSTLQTRIYDDLSILEKELTHDAHVEFLLERSTIHIHHGFDKLARADLETARSARQFEFALTGLLGKRTKFQEKDTSQLVVLAKSHEIGGAQSREETENASTQADRSNPTNLDLNDDTLLESISFAEKPHGTSSADVKDSGDLTDSLKALDPANQPQLQPLDSVILLSLASSITNTSPQHGLTREETLPYATRVLEGGSSNWQVYTQALLVRSRIEGYKSRTVERGLLQLQALVDQVIAETKGEGTTSADDSAAPASTFLPRAKESESAPVTERVRFLFQLGTPLRWELEAELASRWVSLGGLRTALEIYERLEMWAEAALCWAATDREDKAAKIVRRLLFHRSNSSTDDVDDEAEEWKGPARDPPPIDAPRLYCILGDMDQSVEMYEQAWTVSKERYARAQRSLGRLYIQKHDYTKAADAYSKSLKVNQLNGGSWFALGCALLELANYNKAVEAFSRCVQLDETDAEAWSNLAAALLRTEPDGTTRFAIHETEPLDDEEEAGATVAPPLDGRQQIKVDALKAFKRAAVLKHDSYRIWENVLIVATSLVPPDYATMLQAQRQIVQLRATKDGEQAIDVEILELLVDFVISTSDTYDPTKPGLVRMTVKFVDEMIVPLITASARLWQLVARLALWRNKPAVALDAEEKAWRVVTNQPGWDTSAVEEARWNEVVDATVRLSDAYENLGPRERTEGMAAGELVAKDWKFKARSALRGIMGRGKDVWADTEGWDRLKQTMDGLRS